MKTASVSAGPSAPAILRRRLVAVVVVVACARQLAGFLWAAATAD